MMRDCSTCFYRDFDRGYSACVTCSGYANWTARDTFLKEHRVEEDVVNNPKHYTHGGIEPIDAIEAWDLNFRLANVIKYVARADHKGKPVEDLKKALWYLQREISKRESNA